jgi:DNA-binding transcriptional regulator YiaG
LLKGVEGMTKDLDIQTGKDTGDLTENHKITGDDIKKLRKQLGLTQKQFARKIGITDITVSRWEGQKQEKVNITGTTGEVLKAMIVGFGIASLGLVGAAAGGSAYWIYSQLKKVFEGGNQTGDDEGDSEKEDK